MAVKVSIVVPTYRTNLDDLDALVAAVDAQTLPADELELVFVDDGSPDGTFDKLRTVAAVRANTFVEQIENSGSPCRPRNVGTALASGEYVFFMDHDDLLYPQGLEKAYELASRTDADIVNAKEARSKGWAWGWDVFAGDRDTNSNENISALLPMTPHKLYRRQFLLTNGVKFEEIRKLMWEDIRFNVLAFSKGAKVAVLGRYPCYHWVNHAGSSSTSFGRDPNEKWRQLEGLLQYFETCLPAGPHLDELLRHTYRVRFLDRVGDWMLRATAERVATEFNHARKLAERYIPEPLDAGLSTVLRARSYCLRTGALNTARELATIERNFTLGVQTAQIGWHGTSLRVSVRAEAQDSQGKILQLYFQGDQLYREIDKEIRSHLGAGQLDFAREIGQGNVELGVKARMTREDWHVGVAAPTKLEAGADGYYQIGADLATQIDVISGIHGRPFGRQAFDVSISVGMLGRRFHRGLPVSAQSLYRGALIEGVAVVAYKNRSGLLTVDVGENVKNVAALAGSAATQVAISTTPRYSRLTLTLPEVHVWGTTRLEGVMILRPVGMGPAVDVIEVKAALIGEAGQARITTTDSLVPAGEYSIAVTFNGRTTETGKEIVVISRRPLVQRLRPLRNLPHRILRKVRRGWRQRAPL